MRRLVWICAGRKPIMLVLSWRGSFYNKEYIEGLVIGQIAPFFYS
jgi:hypothetical protein